MYLGWCDEENLFEHNCSWDVDRVGGPPAWLQAPLCEKCRMCGAEMLFVGQFSCPLDSIHHRVLYIFVCLSLSCSLSNQNWVVVRCQKKIEKFSEKFETKSVFNEFSFGDLDWGTDGGEDLQQEKIKGDEINENFNELRIESGDNSKTEISKGDFQAFYVNVSLEEKCEENLDHEFEILQTYLKTENMTMDDIEKSASNKSGSEPYEKAASKSISNVQKKFLKRVKRLPKQVLRYAYGDKPLCLNADIGEVEDCVCGGRRVFELQLMPSLMEFLLPIDLRHCIPVESSCVYIFTCSKHCSNTPSQEMVIVQSEVEVTTRNILPTKK